MKLVQLTKIVAETLPDTRRFLLLNPDHIVSLELTDDFGTIITTTTGECHIVEESALGIGEFITDDNIIIVKDS